MRRCQLVFGRRVVVCFFLFFYLLFFYMCGCMLLLNSKHNITSLCISLPLPEHLSFVRESLEISFSLYQVANWVSVRMSSPRPSKNRVHKGGSSRRHSHTPVTTLSLLSDSVISEYEKNFTKRKTVKQFVAYGQTLSRMRISEVFKTATI